MIQLLMNNQKSLPKQIINYFLAQFLSFDVTHNCDQQIC